MRSLARMRALAACALLLCSVIAAAAQADDTAAAAPAEQQEPSINDAATAAATAPSKTPSTATAATTTPAAASNNNAGSGTNASIAAPLYVAVPAAKVKASSVDSPKYAAANGMDGNNGTAWLSTSPVNAGDGQWLERDFGSPVIVQAFRIGSWIDARTVTAGKAILRAMSYHQKMLVCFADHHTLAASTDSPIDFALQASDDESNWATIASVKNETTW